MSDVKEVWVLRPPKMKLQWPVQLHRDESTARAILDEHHKCGIDSTLTRETLLTPAHAAVIAAAKAFCADRTLIALEHKMIDAVADLRALEVLP